MRDAEFLLRIAYLARILLAVPLVLLLVGCDGGWEEQPAKGRSRAWKKGAVTRFDHNGDGRIDEEIDESATERQPIVRRDTDHDGYFDLRYELGPFGIAQNLLRVREKAPRMD